MSTDMITVMLVSPITGGLMLSGWLWARQAWLERRAVAREKAEFRRMLPYALKGDFGARIWVRRHAANLKDLGA